MILQIRPFIIGPCTDVSSASVLELCVIGKVGDVDIMLQIFVNKLQIHMLCGLQLPQGPGWHRFMHKESGETSYYSVLSNVTGSLAKLADVDHVLLELIHITPNP